MHQSINLTHGEYPCQCLAQTVWYPEQSNLCLISINLTHGEYPCQCLAQTVWYPEQSNLCLIWDIEEIRSIGLLDHQQKVTFFVVSSMLALRCTEQNIAKYRESKAPTAETIHTFDYSRRLHLQEICFIIQSSIFRVHWFTGSRVFSLSIDIRPFSPYRS